MHILALSKAAGQRVGAGGARGRLRAQQPPRSRARLVRPRLTGIIELYHRLEALPPDLLSYTLRKLRPWDRAPAAATNRLLRATLAAAVHHLPCMPLLQLPHLLDRFPNAESALICDALTDGPPPCAEAFAAACPYVSLQFKP